jgi:alkylhydroperoxidase family enzyme
LASFIDTVARHAYKVTDADVAGLKEAGYSDDAIFEITVAAAVGAAMHRLDRGMAALRGEEPD